MKKLLKLVAPWIFCAAIFYFLFRQFGKNGTLKPEDILFTLKQANLPLFVFFGFLYFVTVMIIDCLALQRVMGRFVTTMGFWETIRVRGVSYLLMIFNYGAGQGGFSIYLKKTHNAPISKSLGAMFFVTVCDALLTLTSGFLALFFVDEVRIGDWQLKPAALTFMPLVYVAVILWVLFWRYLDSPIVKKLTRFKIIQRLLAHGIFHIFREAKLRDYIMILLWRVPLLVCVIGSYLLAIIACHAWLPPKILYLYNPIILFICTLPLTPAGLGTSQLLIIFFFRDHLVSPLIDSGILTPEKILLATSITWILMNQVIKALFGSLCLNLTSRDLFEEKSCQPQTTAS